MATIPDISTQIALGGTLHSIAQGNTVVYTHEVMEYDWGGKEAKQHDINQELRNFKYNIMGSLGAVSYMNDQNWTRDANNVYLNWKNSDGTNTTGSAHKTGIGAATNTNAGVLVAADKAFLMREQSSGTTTATQINLGATSKFYVLEASGNITLSVTGSLSAGRELELVVHNNSAADISVTMPTAGVVNITDPIIYIEKGKYGEINFISQNGTIYLRAVGTHKSDSAEFPKGTILMFYGEISDIPEGWTFCNGANGTPDLTNRFVQGAAYNSEVGSTGGTNTYYLTKAQLPPHSHTFSFGWEKWGDNANSRPFLGSSGSTVTTSSVGNGAPIDNRPAYCKLYFIMKL